MAFLRTIKILEEIHLLFEESDFELRLNKKLHKSNRYKIQPVFNTNGTITVVASYGNGNAVYSEAPAVRQKDDILPMLTTVKVSR